MSTATAAPRPKSGLAATGARRTAGWLVLLAALAAIAVASVALGSRPVDPATLLEVLRHPDGSLDSVAVHDLRLPRTALGVTVGLALALAGALIQAMTRNPLADPGILGVNAGAGFAVVLAAGVFGVTNPLGYVWFAFAGALGATVVVYVLGGAGRGGATPIRLTLAGVAFAAVLGGIGTAVTLLDPAAFDQVRFWSAGTLLGRPFSVLRDLGPFLLAGTVTALALGRGLNAIALGDDLARSLGTRIAATRAWGVVAVTLLCGAATAAAGPVGFVGLMVPHLARWIVGPDQRWIMAYACLMGPILLLSADILGRVLMPPAEIPVSVVTAFVGAPVLIALVRRAKASGL